MKELTYQIAPGRTLTAWIDEHTVTLAEHIDEPEPHHGGHLTLPRALLFGEAQRDPRQRELGL